MSTLRLAAQALRRSQRDRTSRLSSRRGAAGKPPNYRRIPTSPGFWDVIHGWSREVAKEMTQEIRRLGLPYKALVSPLGRKTTVESFNGGASLDTSPRLDESQRADVLEVMERVLLRHRGALRVTKIDPVSSWVGVDFSTVVDDLDEFLALVQGGEPRVTGVKMVDDSQAPNNSWVYHVTGDNLGAGGITSGDAHEEIVDWLRSHRPDLLPMDRSGVARNTLEYDFRQNVWVIYHHTYPSFGPLLD